MTRWNIKKILIYSHDSRRRDIDLRVGQVNIISGPSHTGKSAIVHIIDYCLGSKDCHLPGVTSEKASWVGLLWQNASSHVIICRRVPRAMESTSNDMYWRQGFGDGDDFVPVTQEDITITGSRTEVIQLLEKTFGIGDIGSETLGSPRPRKRISARQLMPYLLLSDDVIINSTVLLRGSSDERRQSIIDSLPYMLGISDEKMAAMESELARIDKELRKRRKDAKFDEAISNDVDSKTLALLKEAQQVGLITNSPGFSSGSHIDLLKRALDWSPTTQQPIDDTELTALYREESEILTRITSLKKSITSAENALMSSSDFTGTVTQQERKLKHIEAFPEAKDIETCPVCCSELKVQLPSVTNMRNALSGIREELKNVTQGRPKLDNFVNELKDELSSSQDRLKSIRTQVKNLVGESEASETLKDNNLRISRVVGRISLFLDTLVEVVHEVKQDDLQLLKRHDELSQIVDVENKKKLIDVEQQRIGWIATEILHSLPFEPEYRNSAVYFLARNLECGIITSDRKMKMVEVGSDENYLSLHLAILLAFHRIFKHKNRPVPGLLVIDQLSRPYYPPEQDVVEISNSESESANLYKYFTFLFQEVAREDDLQILILEHAYFSNEPEFVEAVGDGRWSNGHRLIPSDWPTANNSGN